MKNKNFLNKLRSKASFQIEIERQLLPRLKVMGYILFTISIIAVAFAIFSPKEREEYTAINEMQSSGIALFTDDTPLELDPREVLNFYTVGLIFALGGALLLFFTWKKAKTIKIK